MTAQPPSEPAADSGNSGQAPAGSASVALEGQWVVERPEPGLARGHYAWPAWAIGVLGGVMVCVGLVYLVLRTRRLLKR